MGQVSTLSLALRSQGGLTSMDRIMRMLELKLNEAGWIDDLHHHAKGTAYPLDSFETSPVLNKVKH